MVYQHEAVEHFDHDEFHAAEAVRLRRVLGEGGDAGHDGGQVVGQIAGETVGGGDEQAVGGYSDRVGDAVGGAGKVGDEPAEVVVCGSHGWCVPIWPRRARRPPGSR
ncbi:hypothetical protein GCM10010094_92320 [Streptomyces flaveus]|uniref:Uncharacterized protein n=1 Tax=Streptomyces flaveus TaxID=66370 RepID=A0A917RPH5_9ACTN|nr:hypothetical protein GCM10010094_92320 [Streptomyces flaveus]